MVRLASNEFIWCYSKLDQSIFNFIQSWAVTLDGSKTMFAVFATPDRAFAEMRDILEKRDLLTHEQEIPLPFYSINRTMPEYEPERDYAGYSSRYYYAQQITCDACDEIISLAQYNTGFCTCGEPIDENTATFSTYDLSDKDDDEAEEDEWHYVSSDTKPTPFKVDYEFNLWSDTKGERDFNIMGITRQFYKNRNTGMLYLNVAYPEPMSTVKIVCNDLTITDNSDLEPGEGSANYRVTMQFTAHTWLPPVIDRNGVVKTLTVEGYDTDTEEEYFTIDNVFD